MAARRTPPKRIIKVPTNCPFCNKKVEPTYFDYKTLSKFISDRARIYGRSRTGVCSKHQRILTTEIKRARFLGLLPFVPAI